MSHQSFIFFQKENNNNNNNNNNNINNINNVHRKNRCSFWDYTPNNFKLLFLLLLSTSSLEICLSNTFTDCYEKFTVLQQLINAQTA